MARGRQPRRELPANQTNHKAWTAAITGALMPVILWFIFGEPLPTDWPFALSELVILVTTAIMTGGINASAVWRVANYEPLPTPKKAEGKHYAS